MIMGLFKKKRSDAEILEKAKEISFQELLRTPPTDYDAVERVYVGWLLTGVPRDSFRRVHKRRVIEDFSQGELLNLQPGEVYSEKVGDADYIFEEAGKWDQIGAKDRQDSYRNAKGSIRTIMQRDHVAKLPKVRQIAHKLLEVRPNMELRAEDNGLRAILVQKVMGRKVCVWSSYTVDQHEVGESHDPEQSIYEGFIYEVENGAKGPLVEIADAIWKYYEQLWESAKPVPELLKNITRELNGGNGNNKNGLDAKISDFPVVPEDQKKE
jgi:hypothetical protein